MSSAAARGGGALRGGTQSDAASHRVVEPLGATKRNFGEGWLSGRGCSALGRSAAPSCPSPPSLVPPTLTDPHPHLIPLLQVVVEDADQMSGPGPPIFGLL